MTDYDHRPPCLIIQDGDEYIRVDMTTGEVIEDTVKRKQYKGDYVKPLDTVCSKEELLKYIEDRPKKKSSGGLRNDSVQRLIEVFDKIEGSNKRGDLDHLDLPNLHNKRVMKLPHYKVLKVLAQEVMYRNLIIEDKKTVAKWLGTSSKNLMVKLAPLIEAQYLRVTPMHHNEIKIEMHPMFGWRYERNDYALEEAVKGWYFSAE